MCFIWSYLERFFYLTPNDSGWFTGLKKSLKEKNTRIDKKKRINYGKDDNNWTRMKKKNEPTRLGEFFKSSVPMAWVKSQIFKAIRNTSRVGGHPDLGGKLIPEGRNCYRRSKLPVPQVTRHYAV